MAEYSEKQILELHKRCLNGDQEARNKLFFIHLPLVRGLVKRYDSFAAHTEDIFQEGCMGLLRALEGYDPERGTRFSTYAVPFILGNIRQYLRQSGHLLKHSRSRLELFSQLVRSMELLEQTLGRKPLTEELARETGMSKEETAWIMEECLPPLPLHEERLTEEETGPGSSEEKTLQKIIMQEKLNELPPLERQVIVLRFFMEKSQQEVGQMLGISQSRVSRLEKKVFEWWKEGDKEEDE